MTLPIVSIPVGVLVERPGNPNRMDPGDYDRLVGAVRRVGFLQPVLVRPAASDRYEIVDGAHRVRAARDAKLASVPCVVASLTDEEAAAVQVGMNRLRGELDVGAVADVLAALSAAGWSSEDLALTGYGEEDIAALLRVGEEEDPFGGDAGVPPAIVGGDAEPAFVLEVPLPDAATLTKVRRRLKKAGGGDIGVGLLRALGEDE